MSGSSECEKFPVGVSDEQKALTIDLASVKKVVTILLEKEDIDYREVGVLFVDKNEISRLHGDFFDDPSPTDCISFPVDPEDEFFQYSLGQIYICPEVGLEYAEKHAIDPYEEITLYLVHGFLHLIGYDDKKKEARLKMRQKEKEYLKLLKDKDAILKPPKTRARNSSRISSK